MSVNELLDRLFIDPKTGFVGAEKLLKRAKQYNPKITMKQVKGFLDDNSINQVFQNPLTSKHLPRIHGKIGHYQADLTFLTRYKKQNSNFHILLVVIVVNNFKGKTQKSVYEALEYIQKQALKHGRPINVLHTDNGKEFQNASIRNLQSDTILNKYSVTRMMRNVWE